MAKKRGSKIHKIKSSTVKMVEFDKVKERDHEHSDSEENSPIPKSLANGSVDDSRCITGEYSSPDARKFDVAGLKDLE